MDSSGDNSFVAFKHFPWLDVPSSKIKEEIKFNFEKMEIFWENELIKTLNFLKECLENLHFPENSLRVKEEHIISCKDAYEAQSLAFSELKEKTKILEIELKQTTSKVSEEDFNNLVQEVIQLERAKEKRMKELTMERDMLIKRSQFYKHYLDCRITFSKPDLFTVYFEPVKETGLSEKYIKLASDDLYLWEFVNGTLNLEQIEKVRLLLKEKNSISRVLWEVRNIFKNN